MKTKLFMLLAGIVLLASCGGHGSYESADTVANSNDSTKLVKTADMRIKVKNVQSAAETVSKLTLVCGGRVMHHTQQSNVVNHQDITLANDSVKKLTVYNTAADMVLKVPSDAVELFMDSLNHLSTFIDQRKMDIEDRTLNYMSEKLKANNRQASVEMRKSIKLTQNGADSILKLKDDVVDRKIANLKTDDDVKFSTLTLTLYQNNTVSQEVIPSEDLSDYNSSLFVRVGLAFSRGWFYFSQLLVGILNLWAFILAGAAIWILIWRYQKHKKLTKPVEEPVKS